MVVDSLGELKFAFRDWRSSKRYPREPVSAELLDRARRAVAVHGLGAVVKATQFGRSRLSGKITGSSKKSKAAAVAVVPAFSRLELAGPPAAVWPLAEAETPSGVKLRIFQMTPQTIGLLTGFCGTGGGR